MVPRTSDGAAGALIRGPRESSAKQALSAAGQSLEPPSADSCAGPRLAFHCAYAPLQSAGARGGVSVAVILFNRPPRRPRAIIPAGSPARWRDAGADGARAGAPSRGRVTSEPSLHPLPRGDLGPASCAAWVVLALPTRPGKRPPARDARFEPPLAGRGALGPARRTTAPRITRQAAPDAPLRDAR